MMDRLYFSADLALCELYSLSDSFWAHFLGLIVQANTNPVLSSTPKMFLLFFEEELVQEKIA
jgi:hypothetical protein